MISCRIYDMLYEFWGNKLKNNSFFLWVDELIDFISKWYVVVFV